MKTLLLLLSGLLCMQAMAETKDTLPGSKMFSIRAQYGFAIAHRPTIRHIQKNHVKGLELEYVIPTDGCYDWQQPFLLPYFSTAYQYLDLGNPELLGGGHALTARMVFPLNRNRRISSFVSSGFGIGYIEKRFDRLENFKNVAIGSHINAVVSFSYRAAVRTGKHSTVDLGLTFTHFSNGSYKMPNLGINVPTLHAGYTRYFGKPLACKVYELPKAERGSVNRIVLTGGIKSLDGPEASMSYGVSAIEVSRQYILSHKSRLGGGIDLFYDRTLPWKLNSLYHEGLKTNVAFRAGIHAGYELTPGRWTLLFQNGVYIYDEYDEDGFLYSKMGVEYNFTSHLFACFHLKTHFAKADYFEYGLGYMF